MQSGEQFFTSAHIKEQEETVKQLQKEWDGVNNRIDRINESIQKDNIVLEATKEKAGQLAQSLHGVDNSGGILSNVLEEADKRMEKFSNRVKGLAKRVFVFTMITSALRNVKDWLGNVVRGNAEASAAMAKLKGALLTMAQPLVDIIIPAFTAFVNILTRVVSAIAALISALFGTTIDQSKEAAEALNQETTALNATGGAAKKAGKSLAAFDEINKLTAETESGGGGGASMIQPDFSFDTSNLEGAMDRILNLAKLIAAALLAWKLGNGFMDSLQKFVGLMIAIDGAIRLAKGTWDAWQKGLDWDNFMQMLLGAVELVAGLGIAFGSTGAAIGLVVSGLTFLITGFHDAMENGWNLQNTLMSIAGLMMGGLGISMLTGSWIPLLIAGIASLLLALTVATGNGNALIAGVQEMLQGFLDFFKGIFYGDINLVMQGVNGIFQGFKTVVLSIIQGVQDTINSFLDWLDEKTHGKLHGIIEWVREFLNSEFDVLKSMFSGLADAAQQIFEGIIKFLTGVFTNDWELAWEGVLEIFKGCWNGIITVLESGLNFVINAINSFIRAVNNVIARISAFFGGRGMTIPTIPKVELPRLATGAVIPPNREFMAVLGDQKSGNNIEAPESLIRRIVREESGNGNGDMTIILECDKIQFAKLVYKLNKSEGKRIGVSLAEV